MFENLPEEAKARLGGATAALGGRPMTKAQLEGPGSAGHLVSWRARERRKSLSLSQHEVALKMGAEGVDISDATYSRIEIGKNELVKDVNTLIALSRALDCTVTYLVGLTSRYDKWTPD